MPLRGMLVFPRGVRRRTLADAFSFANAIHAALRHLHDHGFAHLDVKPSNILVKHNDENTATIFKLGDLGCAMAIDELQEMHPPQDGDHAEYMVTRNYRPPEVMLGNALSDTVDLWGLGCVAVQFVTGEVLFHARHDIGMMYEFTVTIGPPPAHILNGCPLATKFFSYDGEVR